MQIRNATSTDLPEIVRIYNSTIASRVVTADLKPFSVSEKKPWFATHNASTRPLWVVEIDGKIIGWISFQDFKSRAAYDQTAEISIYLDESKRGQGLGKKLLQYSIDKCPELAITRLVGFIFAHNTASIELFKQLDFEEWAHLPDIALLDNVSASLKIFGRVV